MEISYSLRRLLRFATIYGLRRTLFKAAGRLRGGRLWWLGVLPFRGRRDIAVIGCGQFAFSTIGYVIATQLGNRFAAAFDPAEAATMSFARFYRVKACRSAQEIFADDRISVVYIASNHSTHAEYAINALNVGKAVYIEKPIAVSQEQLELLRAAREAKKGLLFAGYNRPFSSAIRELRKLCAEQNGPLTLSCIIAGHQLSAEHWYRDPAEGTRISGNVGHWLDLMVHILCWRGLPNRWNICCHWSDPKERDDNLSITLISCEKDLVTIAFSSRAEPYEGIGEAIILQWGEITASIHDFRSMTVRRGAGLIRRRYWPKDVGHMGAILQPFSNEHRDFSEVEDSTSLTLAIVDMVRKGDRSREFLFSTGGGAQIVQEALDTSSE